MSTPYYTDENGYTRQVLGRTPRSEWGEWKFHPVQQSPPMEDQMARTVPYIQPDNVANKIDGPFTENQEAINLNASGKL